mgnify:CR=1 FL=1
MSETEEQLREAMKMMEPIQDAIDYDFLFESPLSELRGMKTMVENVRENVQDADISQEHREGILEGVDEMLSAINSALQIRTPIDPRQVECVDCGRTVTVTEDDLKSDPSKLSPWERVRRELEDQGWSESGDPPLCSSCNS